MGKWGKYLKHYNAKWESESELKGKKAEHNLKIQIIFLFFTVYANKNIENNN